VLRRSFDTVTVEKIFGRPTLAGSVDGVEVMGRIFRQTTDERTFADTAIPLVVMAADLTDRSPAPLRLGPLWEALLATTALAGVFPPRERDGHRLVDGLALVPVPTGCLHDCGADITVAVNLIARETLPRWPGADVPAPLPERRRRPGMLETLLEVMDLSQLDTSAGHAGLADVVITPRFGPCHWRDFHLADHFLAAGRAAAEEQLGLLQSLALAAVAIPNHKGGSSESARTVRL
jgi:NTE family protein